MESKRKYQVFVVEDDEDDWSFLQEAFEAVDCTRQLVHFPSPETLLRHLDGLSPDELPDMIILDHQTPGLNGSETVNALKLMNSTYKPKLVVYTTAIAPSTKHQLLQHGVDLCLIKGNSPQEVIDHVKQFCELIDKDTTS